MMAKEMTVNSTENQIKAGLKSLYKTIERVFYLSLKKKIHHTRFHKANGMNAPCEGEVIWVDPIAITGHIQVADWRAMKRRTGFDGGALLDGEWDIARVEKVKFTEMDPFISCSAHWLEGRPWHETSLFNFYQTKLEKGEHCRFPSIVALKERYARLDEIFNTVVTQGKMSTKPEDLVKISLTRDGSLVWGPDGRHRVCIAICAGIESMPAMTGFVHTDAVDVFQSFRV